MNKKVLIVLIVIVALLLGYMLFGSSSAVAPSKDDATKVAQTQPVTQPQPQATTQPQVAANSTNDTKNMGLEIKTTKEGTGAAVKAGDTVSVLYTGKLMDGTVFDASVKHGNQPFDFKVGAGMVIKGWDQGLLGAKVGEKRTLTIPGDLAYGPQGIPGTIPPNATLIFDVEVLAIK